MSKRENTRCIQFGDCCIGCLNRSHKGIHSYLNMKWVQILRFSYFFSLKNKKRKKEREPDFGDENQSKIPVPINKMTFFTTAVTGLKTVVTAIGAGVGVWGVINLLEGYGNDNPGANAHVR